MFTLFCVMGRHSKDPQLSALAKELKDLNFSESPERESDADEMDKEFMRSGTRSWRNVGILPSAINAWAVQIYLGGALRSIGFTNKFCDALRFADMAAMRFWIYRIRGSHQPTDNELNFSVEQAKQDLESEKDAVQLLTAIESYFLDKKIILPYSESEAKRTANRKSRDQRRTVRYEMSQHFNQLEAKLDRVIELLSGKSGRTIDIETFKQSTHDVSRVVAPFHPRPSAPDLANLFSASPQSTHPNQNESKPTDQTKSI